MNNYLTASTPLGPQIRGLGPLGFETNSAGDAPYVFNKVISSTVGLMTVIAAIWFLFVFLSGAYGIISSGGEKGAYEAARKKIQTGLIGLVVVVSGVFIVEFIGWLIGIDLILNPGDLINTIGI